MMSKNAVTNFIKPYGLIGFLSKVSDSPRVLDVGCGNNSPKRIKNLLPNCYYVGLDIGDYNQKLSAESIADEYVICKPEDFASTIATMDPGFDAVVSSHNLEHCNDGASTLVAMLETLNPGALCYLAFPSEASVNFPSRTGTLNFFDDETHTKEPPNLQKVLAIIADCNCRVEILKPRHRPIFLFILGLLLEPLSFFFRKVMAGTWSLYGFETIIWIRKNK